MTGNGNIPYICYFQLSCFAKENTKQSDHVGRAAASLLLSDERLFPNKRKYYHKNIPYNLQFRINMKQRLINIVSYHSLFHSH